VDCVSTGSCWVENHDVVQMCIAILLIQWTGRPMDYTDRNSVIRSNCVAPFALITNGMSFASSRNCPWVSSALHAKAEGSHLLGECMVCQLCDESEVCEMAFGP
jgi:hypothetical protein